jgi:hypothetical protein
MISYSITSSVSASRASMIMREAMPSGIEHGGYRQTEISMDFTVEPEPRTPGGVAIGIPRNSQNVARSVAPTAISALLPYSNFR